MQWYLELCDQLTVLSASSLADALLLIVLHRPEVVLCDPKSLAAEGDPGRIITALHEQGCALIALTTTFEGREALEWQEQGAQAVLLKGLAPRALVQCIGSVCLQSQREHLSAMAPAQRPVWRDGQRGDSADA